jgi:hypothetical protein
MRTRAPAKISIMWETAERGQPNDETEDASGSGSCGHLRLALLPAHRRRRSEQAKAKEQQ